MIIRYRPKYEIASLRDALMGLITIPTLRKSEIFLYGVIEIKPLRGFFGAMRIVIKKKLMNLIGIVTGDIVGSTSISFADRDRLLSVL